MCTYLDFVQFLEERTSTDACCKIEADKSAILLTRRLCDVPSQSHYSCSGSFSAIVYGTDVEKSSVASRRHLDFPADAGPSQRHCVRWDNTAMRTSVSSIMSSTVRAGRP